MLNYVSQRDKINERKSVLAVSKIILKYSVLPSHSKLLVRNIQTMDHKINIEMQFQLLLSINRSHRLENTVAVNWRTHTNAKCTEETRDIFYARMSNKEREV